MVRFPPQNRHRCCECLKLDKQEREQRLTKRAVPVQHGATGARKRSGESTLHLAWIRSMPCAVHRHTCGQKTHAHHVRRATGGGTGHKPDDRWAVPLCCTHHAEGHQTGWVTFEAKYGVDLRAIAEGLAATSPYLEREAA